MSDVEIKRVLQCYRPGGEDKNDPLFAAALKKVASDEALAVWFREEQEFDAAIVRELGKLPVDLALKERILRNGVQRRPGE